MKAERLACEALARLTHASIVRSCNWRLAGFPTRTASVLPSKIKDCPTRPEAKVTLPTRVPLLLPTASKALVSLRHQLTAPEGNGVHDGAFTVSAAAKLLVVPTAFVTCTE